MTRAEFKQVLEQEHVRYDAYNLDGGYVDECLCLDFFEPAWVVYYSERGA